MVRCVNIDEAHFMYTAGEPKYGLPAFRPAWGELAGVRTHLSGVPFLAMSGTLPPHVKACVQELLTPTALVIELTSNWSNLIYTAYPITGAFNNWKNLDFVIPYQYNPHERPRKKIIIYVDQTQSTVNVANYLETLLPFHLQRQGLIREYHSKMSLNYLVDAYNDFSDPDGQCNWLISTEGASTGLDIRDIYAVIQYGVTRDLITAVQRAGRAGRDSGSVAIFLTLYEPWVIDTDISNDTRTLSDPDEPLAQISDSSSKAERTGTSIYRHFQSKGCQRKDYATYMGDRTSEGAPFLALWNILLMCKILN